MVRQARPLVQRISPMTPLQQFVRGLQATKVDFNEAMDEILAFAEIMSNKANSIELDENGNFYVTATGPIEVVIPIMHKQLERLERIQKQKENRID
jgi:hypothetical protein